MDVKYLNLMSHYCDLYLFYIHLVLIQNFLKLFSSSIEVPIASHQYMLVTNVGEPSCLKANSLVHTARIGKVLG